MCVCVSLYISYIRKLSKKNNFQTLKHFYKRTFNYAMISEFYLMKLYRGYHPCP